MNILIDSREKTRKHRAVEYYTMKGHTVQVTTLPVADYVFNDKVCFEYKEIGDMMHSITDGSLFNEASNQAAKYPYHYVIIVGDLGKFVRNNWNYTRNQNYPKYLHDSYARYYGALRRLRVFTVLIEVDTEEHAFTEMLLQAEKCLDHTEDYTGIVRKVKTNNPVLTFLTCIHGISSKKAKMIIDEYDIQTLDELLELDEEKLLEIRGIGNSTARKIMTFLKD